MTVRDIMTPNPITIEPSTTLSEAARLMKENGIRRLPVLDENRLVGIVTDRDLKEAAPSSATSLSVWELSYLLARITVREVMHRAVISVHPSDPVERAALLMNEHKIGGIPVMEDDRVVGIVTESDILRTFANVMGIHGEG